MALGKPLNPEALEIYARDVHSACEGLTNGEMLDILITVIISVIKEAPVTERLIALLNCINSLSNLNFYNQGDSNLSEE